MVMTLVLQTVSNVHRFSSVTSIKLDTNLQTDSCKFVTAKLVFKSIKDTFTCDMQSCGVTCHLIQVNRLCLK